MKRIVVLIIMLILSLCACNGEKGISTDKNLNVQAENPSSAAIKNTSEGSLSLNQSISPAGIQTESDTVNKIINTKWFNPETDTNIGGIGFSDDKNSVINKLGEQINITTKESLYGPSEILEYKNMTVITANVSGAENGTYVVMSIKTDSKDVLGPRGIAVGDDLSDVLTSFSLDSSIDLSQTKCPVMLYGDDNNIQQDFCRIDFSETVGKGEIVFSSGTGHGFTIEFVNQKVSSMKLFEFM